MTDFHESKIVKMIGPINGSNRLFEAPTKFVANTLVLFWNGNTYEPADDRHGWAETSDITIQTNVAPITGDDLQAYYQDKSIAGQLELEDVKGSPFDPNGILP